MNALPSFTGSTKLPTKVAPGSRRSVSPARAPLMAAWRSAPSARKFVCGVDATGSLGGGGSAGGGGGGGGAGVGEPDGCCGAGVLPSDRIVESFFNPPGAVVRYFSDESTI